MLCYVNKKDNVFLFLKINKKLGTDAYITLTKLPSLAEVLG